jgi:hypothetical protein
MENSLFTLPPPLNHYRAFVGSAHVIADAWQRFGVTVTLESGRLLQLRSFSAQSNALQFADELNRFPADV